jgi:hypothetical protein
MLAAVVEEEIQARVRVVQAVVEAVVRVELVTQERLIQVVAAVVLLALAHQAALELLLFVIQ